MKIKPTEEKKTLSGNVVFTDSTKTLTRTDWTWCLLFTPNVREFLDRKYVWYPNTESTRTMNSGEGKFTLVICGLKCGRVDWIVSNVVFGMRRQKFSTWKFIKRNVRVNTDDYFYFILLFEMCMFALRKQTHFGCSFECLECVLGMVFPSILHPIRTFDSISFIFFDCMPFSWYSDVRNIVFTLIYVQTVHISTVDIQSQKCFNQSIPITLHSCGVQI